MAELAELDNYQQRACRLIDKNVFFANDLQSIAMAKAICESCVIIQECYETSIANREYYGTWGGVSEDQRQRIIIKKKPKSA